MYFKVTNTESLFKMFDVIKLFTKTASDFLSLSISLTQTLTIVLELFSNFLLKITDLILTDSQTMNIRLYHLTCFIQN